MKTNIRNVLVTDGNSRASLAITRSLGKQGYNVYVGDKQEKSLASSSKFCFKAIRYPDPVSKPEQFITTIADIIGLYDIHMLIPVTDICVLPISESHLLSEMRCEIPIPNSETLQLAANKHALFKLATKLGVNVPGSIIIESPCDIDATEISFSYPVVIKPSRSRVLVNGQWEFTNVDYAEDEYELRTKLKCIQHSLFPMIIQERIYGPGIGAFYCYDKGHCISKFSHRRIREKPPSGGVSVLRESIEIDPVVDKLSQILLNHLKWHGVAMVEYKYDKKKDIPYLMEINGRFWGSLQLAIDAGVDFPSYLAELSSGRQQQTNSKYKIGVKTRWLWGDIDLLLMLLFKNRSQLHLPADYKSRWRVILDILKPFGKNQYYEVLRLNDINPWLYESKAWFYQILFGKK